MFFSVETFLDIMLLLVNNQTYPTSTAIVQRFLEVYDAEAKNDTYQLGEGEYIQFYVSVIKELLIPDLNEQDIQRIMTKLKVCPFIRGHSEVYEILDGVLLKTVALSPEKLEFIANRVIDQIRLYEYQSSIKKMFGKIANAQTTTDDFKRSILLEEVQAIGREIGDGSSFNCKPAGTGVNKIDFSDPDSVRRGVEQYRANKVTNIFKMGWHGVNRLFGERGGIARGEAVLFCALGFNYKSTMLLNVAKWTVMYNNPIQVEGQGVPTLLFISLENEAAENMMYLYRSVYENISGQSINGKTDDEVIEFILEFFNRRGWKLIIERRLGSDFGFEEFKALYEEYSRAGYHIQMTIIDYLSMMKKNAGSDRMGNHLQIRDVYTNMVNYLKHKECTFITAHQLNRDAAALAKSGVNHVVKKYHMGLLADSVDPYREVDVVIFLQIEANTYGNSYITMYIHKHRYVNNTPEKDRFAAYRFGPTGVPDDLEGKDQSLRDIYSDNYESPDQQSEEIEQAGVQAETADIF